MRISDWSSDVCSSDLPAATVFTAPDASAKCRSIHTGGWRLGNDTRTSRGARRAPQSGRHAAGCGAGGGGAASAAPARRTRLVPAGRIDRLRSEEHTSELQSLMRISYAVFCLAKKYTTTK